MLLPNSEKPNEELNKALQEKTKLQLEILRQVLRRKIQKKWRMRFEEKNVWRERDLKEIQLFNQNFAFKYGVPQNLHYFSQEDTATYFLAEKLFDAGIYNFLDDLLKIIAENHLYTEKVLKNICIRFGVNEEIFGDDLDFVYTLHEGSKYAGFEEWFAEDPELNSVIWFYETLYASESMKALEKLFYEDRSADMMDLVVFLKNYLK